MLIIYIDTFLSFRTYTYNVHVCKRADIYLSIDRPDTYLLVKEMMMFLTLTLSCSSAQALKNEFKFWRWNSSGKTYKKTKGFYTMFYLRYFELLTRVKQNLNTHWYLHTIFLDHKVYYLYDTFHQIFLCYRVSTTDCLL